MSSLRSGSRQQRNLIYYQVVYYPSPLDYQGGVKHISRFKLYLTRACTVSVQGMGILHETVGKQAKSQPRVLKKVIAGPNPYKNKQNQWNQASVQATRTLRFTSNERVTLIKPMENERCASSKHDHDSRVLRKVVPGEKPYETK